MHSTPFLIQRQGYMHSAVCYLIIGLALTASYHTLVNFSLVIAKPKCAISSYCTLLGTKVCIK